MNRFPVLTEKGRLSFLSNDAEQNSHALFVLSQDQKVQQRQRVLDLRWVPLVELPITTLSNLEAIYLHDNQLSTLPELHHFPRLHTLSLGRNRISFIPESIKRIWMPLRRLVLGCNQITRLPFFEEEMMIAHGSVGLNPISEPIGESWMLRKDAQDCIPTLRALSRAFPGISREIIENQQRLFIHNCITLDEPMIYEILFDGYEWKDGTGLVHPEHRYLYEVNALEELLAHIQPDVIVHRTIGQRIHHRF